LVCSPDRILFSFLSAGDRYEKFLAFLLLVGSDRLFAVRRAVSLIAARRTLFNDQKAPDAQQYACCSRIHAAASHHSCETPGESAKRQRGKEFRENEKSAAACEIVTMAALFVGLG
jgi:hypothetical protein